MPSLTVTTDAVVLEISAAKEHRTARVMKGRFIRLRCCENVAEELEIEAGPVFETIGQRLQAVFAGGGIVLETSTFNLLKKQPSAQPGSALTRAVL